MDLEKGKGTCEHIIKLKKLIAVSVVDRLNYHLLTAYSESGSTVKQLTKTFQKRASLLWREPGDNVCKFQVM